MNKLVEDAVGKQVSDMRISGIAYRQDGELLVFRKREIFKSRLACIFTILCVFEYANVYALHDKTDQDFKGPVREIGVERVKVKDEFGNLAEWDRTPISDSFFDQNGRKIRYVEYYGGYEQSCVCKYENDLLVEERCPEVEPVYVSTTPVSSDPELLAFIDEIERVYVYPLLTKDEQIERRSIIQGIEEKQKVIKYIYEDRRLIETNTYGPDGALRYKARYKYEGNRILETRNYNSQGRLTSKTAHFYKGSNKWKDEITEFRLVVNSTRTPSFMTTVVYDDFGRRASASRHTSDGADIYFQARYDEVDSHGNWTRQTVSKRVEKYEKSFWEPTERHYRTITYYDEDKSQR